jgi:hypothetical protein
MAARWEKVEVEKPDWVPTYAVVDLDNSCGKCGSTTKIVWHWATTRACRCGIKSHYRCEKCRPRCRYTFDTNATSEKPEPYKPEVGDRIRFTYCAGDTAWKGAVFDVVDIVHSMLQCKYVEGGSGLRTKPGEKCSFSLHLGHVWKKIKKVESKELKFYKPKPGDRIQFTLCRVNDWVPPDAKMRGIFKHVFKSQTGNRNPMLGKKKNPTASASQESVRDLTKAEIRLADARNAKKVAKLEKEAAKIEKKSSGAPGMFPTPKQFVRRTFTYGPWFLGLIVGFMKYGLPWFKEMIS